MTTKHYAIRERKAVPQPHAADVGLSGLGLFFHHFPSNRFDSYVIKLVVNIC